MAPFPFRLSQFAALALLLAQPALAQQPQEMVVRLTAPRLLTLTLSGAVATLRKVDLPVGTTTYVNSAQPRDTVVDQSPSPGTPITRTTPINLMVSNGIPPQNGASTPGGDSTSIVRPLPVEVPLLVGKTLNAADALLRERELLAGDSTPVPSSQPQGIVVSQSIPYNQQVPRGTRIDMTVSSGLAAAAPAVPTSSPVILWVLGAAGALALFGAAAFALGRTGAKPQTPSHPHPSGIEFRPHRAWGTQRLTAARPAGINTSLTFKVHRDPGQQTTRFDGPHTE